MVLRTFLLTLAPVALATVAPAQPVKRLPLDARATYTIAVAPHAPTTLVFPEAPTGIEGAQVSVEAGDGAAVLLAYREGSTHLTLRATRAEAAAALNLLLGGEVYALDLVGRAEPDRVVRFYRPEKQRTGREILSTLAALAKEQSGAAAARPGWTRHLERAAPTTRVSHAGFAATIEEVFRFEPEGALVFRVTLRSAGAAVRYDPDRIAVRCGAAIYPAGWCDGSGAIPAGGASEVWLAVIAPGAPELSWSVLIPPTS
jgi:hypothetical protein